MNKYRLALLPVILFFILAAAYIIDSNRSQTIARLSAKSPHTSEDNILSSLNVTAFAQDNNQLVWIGTSAGINVYNGHDYIQFFHDANDSTALPDDYINVLHRDRTGRMWAGTQNGVARYEGGYRFKRFQLPSADGNIIRINDCDTNAVIVSTRTTSYRIENDGTVKNVAYRTSRQHLDEVPYDQSIMAKPKDIMTATLTDNDSNLWIGYHNAGYQILSANIAGYKHANANQLASNTKTHDIVALANTGRHILAGTTRRLHIYDCATGNASDIIYDNIFKRGTSKIQYLNNIVTHGTQSAWLIGNRQIVSCHISGTAIDIISSTTAKTNLMLGCGTKMGDYLYVSREDGYIIRCKFGDSHIDSIAVPYPWFDEETQLAPLADGKLLLFMKNMKIATLDTRTRQLTPLNAHGTQDTVSIDPAFVRTDSRHNVWLGTKRSGLYRLSLKDHHIERMKFPNDVHIQALAEDRYGQLWITTLKDVVCYQPQTGAVLMNSLASSSQNQWDRQYFDNSICLAPDGNIVLGSSDGCIFLQPSMSGEKLRKGSLRIYALDIDTTDGRKLALNSDFDDKSCYTLAYNENSLTLRFFYPNYALSSSLMFQYILEGYDRDWHTPTYSGTARFANLAPGKYTFKLRLVTSPDLPPVAERQIEINVKPAPWKSAAAWTLYIACIALLVCYINSLYLRIRTNRMRLIQEQHEREREQHTNEMNMSFFANISHEFRNPLTIIAGPLLALRSDQSLSIRARQSLDRVCLSVNRMLQLIDQMLDFNQLESDALRLKVTRCDAADIIRGITDTFEESASVRGISLNLDTGEANYDTWLDTDKIEKIMSNLFTNALKHTPDNGHIAINMEAQNTPDLGRTLTVTVFNSGSHIDEERIPDVFKRYYQLTDANAQHKYGWGTGIGLYYVKRLVTLHHGNITVRNDASGDGVAFRFSLPMDSAHYKEEERAAEATRMMQIPVSPLSPPVETAAKKNRTKILVVDDDVDVAAYIRSIFDGDYTVTNRYSAEAALSDMAELRPDIILSDIIMGEMSGYDFCRTLKGDIMWSHIPVILITAKSDIGEQISGLRLGAVAYVTKPFDPSYLRALVEAQLAGIQSLRRRLGDSVTTEAVADQMADQDRKFMDELYAIMERRSAELELSVAAVCHDMLVSQSKFNYKLKELTGDTPGTFFRKYKLNRAAQLLRDGKHNVSEVAIMTGFSTAAHFSVAFKKQFGVVPSEYA